MSLSCSWKKINLEGLASDLASRSSHSLALFGNRAYVLLVLLKLCLNDFTPDSGTVAASSNHEPLLVMK